MKRYTLFAGLLFLVAVLSLTLYAHQNRNTMSSTANKNLIVLVQYKTQPAKESQALTALKQLLQQVKQEPNYVGITLHVDPADPTNILLYEQWADEAYYKGDHMKTAHLQQFMTEAMYFLAGPPTISFWRVDN